MSPWIGRAFAALLAGLLLAPVLSLGLEAARGSGELWPHLAAYVLPQAIRDTVLLLAGVGGVVTGNNGPDRQADRLAEEPSRHVRLPPSADRNRTRRPESSVVPKRFHGSRHAA